MKLQTDDFIGDLERWYSAYIGHIKALGYSNNTIDLYKKGIDTFIEYSLQYQDEMELKHINTIYFTGYLNFLEEEARSSGMKSKNGLYLSKSTKQSYFKAVRNLFNFIRDNNDELYTFERYLRNIKIRNTSKKEDNMEYLNDDEVNLLLKELGREKDKKNNYTAYRNSLLIKLMLYAGLRISEALNIKFSDFSNMEYNDVLTINIYAKGGKEQIAFIDKNLIEDELMYFQEYMKNSDDYLIRTRNGKKVNRSTAYSFVNNIYKKAGIRKKGLHILRHTLAMRLAKNNVNLVTIKKILRHSNIATTTIYAKATEKSVVDALKLNTGEEK